MSSNSKPLRMLSVDDDPDIHEWIRAVYDGEFLATASSYDQARELLLRANLDVLLLDIHLGDGNGIELLKAIRTEPEFEHISGLPVVMITASDSGADFESAWDLGAVAYVRKPMDIQSLRQAVQEALAAGG